MDLIERYLGAVAALLPAAQREDIVTELRDLIMNRVEEKEGQLGRRLDKKELEELLREVGHPLAVAGRYGPQQSLIGPEIYPFFLFGVKAALAIAAFVTLIPLVILTATGQIDFAQLLGKALNNFIPNALMMIGAAVLIAAAFERGWFKAGDLGRWRVADLPVLTATGGWASWSGWNAIGAGWGGNSWGKTPPVMGKRFEALFELAATVFFILWWTGVVQLPIVTSINGGDTDFSYALAPILTALHWPILALAVVQAISSLIVVAAPGAVRPRAAVEIVGAIGGLALVYVLWPAQPLIVFNGADASALVDLQRTIDLTFKVIMVGAAAISATKLLTEGWRLIRGPKA